MHLGNLLNILENFMMFNTIYCGCLLYLKLTKKKPKSNNIAKVALRDLEYCGEYSNKLKVSVYYWIYSMDVLMYRSNPDINMIEYYRKWNDDFNHDIDGLILAGIEEAHTDFLNELDNASRENRDPRFKTSDDYDYHCYPTTFNYNDFIVPDQMVEILESLKGGVT